MSTRLPLRDFYNISSLYITTLKAFIAGAGLIILKLTSLRICRSADSNPHCVSNFLNILHDVGKWFVLLSAEYVIS